MLNLQTAIEFIFCCCYVLAAIIFQMAKNSYRNLITNIFFLSRTSSKMILRLKFLDYELFHFICVTLADQKRPGNLLKLLFLTLGTFHMSE